MIVKLNEIPDQGLELQLDQNQKDLKATLDDIVAGENFNLKAQIYPVGDGYDVSGKISGNLKLTCSFCADEFAFPYSEKFHDIFVPNGKNKHKFNKAISKLDDPELDISTYDENGLRLGELVREVIGLAEPYQPQCQNDCKGLCTKCGQNLNESDCGCAKSSTRGEMAFSELKKLQF